MLLVLCPISKELQYVAETLGRQGVALKAIHQAGEKKLYEGDGFLLGQGGYGKVEYALSVQKHLLLHETLTGVLCVGSAGSMAEEVKPLDLVVASYTAEHDFKEGFAPSGKGVPKFSASEELLAKAKGSTLPGCSIHYGGIASGDEDIITKERVSEVRARTEGALAVAWEGAGGARACRRLKKNYLEIRAITDTCGNEASQDFIANLEKAMIHAATFLLQRFL